MIGKTLKTMGLVGLLIAAACDGDAPKAAAGDASDKASRPADKADKDSKPSADDEAAKAKAAAVAEVEAQEKAHQAVTALLPELYVRATEDEAIKKIGAIGSHAVGTLSAQLDVHLTAFAKGMEAFGPGKKGSQDDARKASEHQSKVDGLIKALKATGDDGVAAAKKALDAVPADQQKGIADMLRSQHGLFD